MDYKGLGRRIRIRRQELGLIQTEIAVYADISPSFFGHIERGSRKASMETLLKIANVLQTTPDRLLVDSFNPTLGNPYIQFEQIRAAANLLNGFLQMIENTNDFT